jgi:hypothetical protein
MNEPNENESDAPELDVLDLATTARDQCRDLSQTLRGRLKLSPGITRRSSRSCRMPRVC